MHLSVQGRTSSVQQAAGSLFWDSVSRRASGKVNIKGCYDMVIWEKDRLFLFYQDVSDLYKLCSFKHCTYDKLHYNRITCKYIIL